MHPIRTEHLTKTYRGGPAAMYQTDRDVIDLPCATVDNMVISCWRPTLRERLSLLVFGRVWLTVVGPPPPFAVHAERNFIRAEYEEL